MPTQARHTAGIALGRRGYRVIEGGPEVWRSTADRRAAQGPAGGWSGHFVNDAYANTIFDLTEWIDRDHDPVVVRYAYQVRYCNELRGGVRWQYRLDHHPIKDAEIFVPHYHDHEAQDGEHDPRPFGRFLHLSEALPLLEGLVGTRIGGCSGPVPGIRGRAPYQASEGSVMIEP